MSDVLQVLRREFEREDGTFLIELRGAGIVWDRAAFSRLEQAMRAVCTEFQGRDDMPRWLAEGFYEVSHFVAEWTGHPSFPRPEPVEYYEQCLERLRDLCDWFFRGRHVYQEPHVWRDL